MTESEWLASSDPAPMLLLDGLENPDRALTRKLRLFAAACCRRIWHLLPDEDSRRRLEWLERFADGAATETELQDALPSIGPGTFSYSPESRRYVAFGHSCSVDPAEKARLAVLASAGAGPALFQLRYGRAHAVDAVWRHAGPAARKAEWAAQADLLRCILGNPFQEARFDPAWATPRVLAMARQAYDDRDFAVLPVLADALEDAGCDEARMLRHLRSSGPHARGCWALDLLLGKA
jgi:hypothetical protein